MKGRCVNTMFFTALSLLLSVTGGDRRGTLFEMQRRYRLHRKLKAPPNPAPPLDKAACSRSNWSERDSSRCLRYESQPFQLHGEEQDSSLPALRQQPRPSLLRLGSQREGQPLLSAEALQRHVGPPLSRRGSLAREAPAQSPC